MVSWTSVFVISRYSVHVFLYFPCVTECLVLSTCARAVLIEKDKNPVWKYGSVDEVPRDLVNSFFETIVEGVTDIKVDD